MNRATGDIARMLEEQLAHTKARILQQLLGSDPVRSGGESAITVAGRLNEMARQILERRRLRARHFPADLFQELGWEILLSLFIAAQDGTRLSGAALTESLGGAASSMNRWAKYLAETGFIKRYPNIDDRRMMLLELTSDGERAVLDYLSEIASLPPL